MLRRVHVPDLHPGKFTLPMTEAHHVRDVLRLEAGARLELFNDAGDTAIGVIAHVNSANVVVEVTAVHPAGTNMSIRLTVASAIPKGDRADWMIEKLAELGVSHFIPLAAERSVVLPAGKNKILRWERSAIEAAKQSRRPGVMTIEELTPLQDAIRSVQRGWCLSTAADAIAVRDAVDQPSQGEFILFVGPEGGWTEGELSRMKSAGFIGVSLTATVLRVETAAVAAAAVVLCLGTGV